MQMDIYGTKPLTKAKKVELALIDAGMRGITNVALNRLTFRYGAVIHEMRRDGHWIVTGPTNKHGLVKYTYMGKK